MDMSYLFSRDDKKEREKEADESFYTIVEMW